ncbi:MAG: hypothetical protein PUH48_04185 [Prevotella sp.]|nr:hypothetical protein [Prevotella sp.]
MASIRFKFRASAVSGKQGTLFIQVIHRRVARQVSTQYKLYPGEWDPAGQSVTVPKDTLPDRSRYLHAVQEALQQDASRLQLIILALDHSRKEFQAEDVIRHLYQTSLNSLCRFLNGRLLTFDGIDSSLMLSYNTTC